MSRDTTVTSCRSTGPHGGRGAAAASWLLTRAPGGGGRVPDSARAPDTARARGWGRARSSSEPVPPAQSVPAVQPVSPAQSVSAVQPMPAKTVPAVHRRPWPRLSPWPRLRPCPRFSPCPRFRPCPRPATASERRRVERLCMRCPSGEVPPPEMIRRLREPDVSLRTVRRFAGRVSRFTGAGRRHVLKRTQQDRVRCPAALSQRVASGGLSCSHPGLRPPWPQNRPFMGAVTDCVHTSTDRSPG